MIFNPFAIEKNIRMEIDIQNTTMLLKDFYTIQKIEEVENGKYTAFIHLNKDHEVFKGHFPGNPVLPGVCTMQIIKELTETITQKAMVLSRAINVKFMALINPDVNPTLRLELNIETLESGEIKVKNSTYFDATLALKLSNTYKVIEK